MEGTGPETLLRIQSFNFAESDKLPTIYFHWKMPALCLTNRRLAVIRKWQKRKSSGKYTASDLDEALLNVGNILIPLRDITEVKAGRTKGLVLI